MPEEIFDIVNERDEVIGQSTRREVHARGLWHRAVHVLVFNARGEVFLQKRSMRKDIAAGKWTAARITTRARCARCARKSDCTCRSRRRGFSRLTRARRRAGNFAGFIAAKAKGHSCCILTKSRRAHGSRRTR